MNKVSHYFLISALILTLPACPTSPSGREETLSGRLEARAFWVVDGSLSRQSAEMFLERYLFPTSLALMLWTEFSVRGEEVRFDTLGGYRILRKQRVLTEALGAYALHGYDLIVDISRAPPGPKSRTIGSFQVRFSYAESIANGGPDNGSPGVLPQPLEQALIAGIRADGRSAGMARVATIDYVGSGEFTATVLIGN
jgi:hypothetical protein